jgi:C_GCAxxG_C_C family probable redox protein
LGKLFHKEIKEQTVNAAIGLHDGGGYRAQCGIVEGSLMFIALMSKEEYKKSVTEIAGFCFDFVEMFEKEFKSLRCYDLRPNGFREEFMRGVDQKRNTMYLCILHETVSQD